MEEEQYFQFREQDKTALFIDGNYMLSISRFLNIKLDMEELFEEITKGFLRFRTYWFAALESTTDRNNNAYRFLDRLRYIPRTRVYAGRMTKHSHGHYESALRTDAGIALAVNMIETARSDRIDHIMLIACDPEYVPAIRAVQRMGIIVRLIYPEFLGDLDPHPDLLKAVDERNAIDAPFFEQYEYVNDLDFDEDEDIDDINEFDDVIDEEYEDEIEIVDPEIDETAQ